MHDVPSQRRRAPAERQCATCGAVGELTDEFTVRWTDLTRSVISMDEKRAHYEEIRDTAQKQTRLRDEIEARAAEYDAFDRLVAPSPAGAAEL